MHMESKIYASTPTSLFPSVSPGTDRLVGVVIVYPAAPQRTMVNTCLDINLEDRQTVPDPDFGLPEVSGGHCQGW